MLRLPDDVASMVIGMAMILKKRDAFAAVFDELLTEPIVLIASNACLPSSVDYVFAERMPPLVELS